MSGVKIENLNFWIGFWSTTFLVISMSMGVYRLYLEREQAKVRVLMEKLIYLNEQILLKIQKNGGDK